MHIHDHDLVLIRGLFLGRSTFWDFFQKSHNIIFGPFLTFLHFLFNESKLSEKYVILVNF